MKNRKLLLLVVLICIFLPLLYFWGYPTLLDYLNKDKLQDNQELIVTPKNPLVHFPQTNPLFTNDNELQWNLFQGVVDSYGSINGINYVVISYFGENNEEMKVKVLLNTNEKLFPNAVLDKKKTDPVYYNSIDRRYVSRVSFHEKFSDLKNVDSLVYMTLEEFQKTFTPGMSLTFSIFTNFPNNLDIESKKCTKEYGQIHCVIANLMYSLAPDLNLFWQQKRVSEQSILVPTFIFATLNGDETK